MSHYQRVVLYLIKPSKYDDDGYVIRHWKGVLPSNTLACLNGLSHDVQQRQVLGKDLKWEIHTLDETVERVNVARITRQAKRKNTKTIIGLVGVQSNQFPRAADLAYQFKKANVDVLIGGFHVSGTLATLSEIPPEIRALQKAGISVVAGEIEGRWGAILQDAMRDQLLPLYNFLHAPPELTRAPMPAIPHRLLNKYAVKHYVTLDCGRGCPFNCSFCTVINVQGRQMRFRSVQCVLDFLRQNYYENKITNYFFTDDNFSRNKNWGAIFDEMIQLREQEGICLSFMLQVDTQSHRIPHFVEKAACAGASQVFIGMESLNEENLKAAGKKQNRTSEYQTMIHHYHQAGIATHIAYIIGFPFDTEASVERDMERLQIELGAEQASFFMLTPLPGSMDYIRFLKDKIIVDADLNNFDSFHETFGHPRMQQGAWKKTYRQVWRSFYALKNMTRILKQVKPEKYWAVFMNFVWYKNAIEVENGHPMIHGFFRLKHRRDRRPTWLLESRLAYCWRRVKDIGGCVAGWIKLFFEMEALWRATRPRINWLFRLETKLKRTVAWWDLLFVFRLLRAFSLYFQFTVSILKQAMFRIK